MLRLLQLPHTLHLFRSVLRQQCSRPTCSLTAESKHILISCPVYDTSDLGTHSSHGFHISAWHPTSDEADECSSWHSLPVHFPGICPVSSLTAAHSGAGTEAVLRAGGYLGMVETHFHCLSISVLFQAAKQLVMPIHPTASQALWQPAAGRMSLYCKSREPGTLCTCRRKPSPSHLCMRFCPGIQVPCRLTSF